MRLERITRLDKNGHSFEIGISCPEDFPCLLEMYLTFSPRPASQGLPPENPEACRNWVKTLFETGTNLLACRGNRVIGHAALVPDIKGGSGEFVIFVDQNDRNLGIGTELTRCAFEQSRRLGIDCVWLTVNVLNSVAIKLYKKFGFQYCDADSYERVMSAKLK
jgi:RimJ/RimL family protein N-acetyltransferase